VKAHGPSRREATTLSRPPTVVAMRYERLDILVHAVHAATLAAAFAPSAFAQYSPDPATPLALRATPSDDVQPKIATAPMGNQWIGYLSGPGYDVYLDCLDRNGVSIFGTPILIEDRDLASTVDWDLVSDVFGNAYLTYHVTANGGSDHAQKVACVSEKGFVRWSRPFAQGPAGTLGNGRVAVASDGFVWAATAVGFETAVQRLDPLDGDPTFTVELLVREKGAQQVCADLQASSDGSVILSTVRSTDPLGDRILRAHRIEAGGSRPWGAAGNAVFASGSLQAGNYPGFLTDGNGGAFFSWYSVEPLNVRVQRMDASGVMLWGKDGVAVSPNPVHDFGGTVAAVNRTNPQSILREDGRIVTFFDAYSAPIDGIVWFGIGAQCFDPDGSRAWGAGGTMVEDYDPFAEGVLYDREVGAALRFGSCVGISWVEFAAPSAAIAKAAHVCADGSVEWKVDFATDPGPKSRLVGSPADSYGAVIAWQGGPDLGNGDIHASRLGDDGTIGPPPALVGDLNGDGRVNAADLTIFLGEWGGTGPADFNHDGVVNAEDLTNLLSNWTP
jgi:hypothetical protein